MSLKIIHFSNTRGNDHDRAAQVKSTWVSSGFSQHPLFKSELKESFALSCKKESMKSNRNMATETTDKESKIMILENQEIRKQLQQFKQGKNTGQYNRSATLGELRVNCSRHKYKF